VKVPEINLGLCLLLCKLVSTLIVKHPFSPFEFGNPTFTTLALLCFQDYHPHSFNPFPSIVSSDAPRGASCEIISLPSMPELCWFRFRHVVDFLPANSWKISPAIRHSCTISDSHLVAVVSLCDSVLRVRNISKGS